MNPTTPLPMPDYSKPSGLAPNRELTAEQIAFFHEHGYVTMQSILPLDELPRVRDVYDHLFAEKTGRSEGNQLDLAGTDEDGKPQSLPQILMPAKYAPELLATQMVANIRRVSEQLLGPGAMMCGDHAINKPPRAGAPTPWHQDEAYWDPMKDYRTISIWIPLQPATKENGCMHFVPGSHRLEVLPHQPIGNDPRVHGLEVVPGAFDFSSAVACELPPGGATIHYGRTLHYAPGNRSDDYRRAYIGMGEQKPTSRATLREYPWKRVRMTLRDERAAKAGGIKA